MRTAIIQTSLSQFLKYGIREVSIQKLIDPLGISTKTVYKYFGNKEQLLEEALLLFYHQQFEILKDLSTKQNSLQLFIDVWYKAVEGEHQVNSVFFEELQYYYPAVKDKIEKAIAKKFSEQFIRMIRAGIAEGFFVAEVDPGLALESIYVLLSGITRENRFVYLKQPPVTVLTHSIGRYIRGMCTAKGIKILDLHLQTLKPFGTVEPKKVIKKVAKKVSRRSVVNQS